MAFKVGDSIRVSRGPFEGDVGVIVEAPAGSPYVKVRLDGYPDDVFEWLFRIWLQLRRPDSELPQFERDEEAIDITGGVPSEDYVRRLRDEG